MSQNKFSAAIANEIKAAEANAIKAKADEIKASRDKIFEDVREQTIVETVASVKAKEFYSGKDGDNKIGVAGNEWIVERKIICGKQCFVMGTSKEEVKQDENTIQLALTLGNETLPQFMGHTISGRYVTKELNIPGMPPCLTKGHTEEERLEDERLAYVTAAKLRGKTGDVDVAEQLIEAKLNPTLEFEKQGHRFIYFKKEKCARSFDGTKVADISDVKEKLSDSTAIELLSSRITIENHTDYCDDGDYDDGYNEGYNDGYDDGYDDGFDDGYDY